jgi:hypothetical protein
MSPHEMSPRRWRPQPQLTATVRLTDNAVRKFSAWLANQPLLPRSANEALNMALESLQPAPLSESFAVMWQTINDLSAELGEIRNRLAAAAHVLGEVEKSSQVMSKQ